VGCRISTEGDGPAVCLALRWEARGGGLRGRSKTANPLRKVTPELDGGWNSTSSS
jgi:hypothetical protein